MPMRVDPAQTPTLWGSGHKVFFLSARKKKRQAKRGDRMSNGAQAPRKQSGRVKGMDHGDGIEHGSLG